MAEPGENKRGLEHLDEYEPKPAKYMRSLHARMAERRLVVILEGASLETVKVGKTFELLNCDQHKNMIVKSGRNPGHIRPDITHQCLLMLMDSPLNRAGLLQVYIHTEKNALIEINPQTRIPRTFPRFCGLMVQLLHKLSVRAADGPQKLLRMIKNPVSDHLPPGCPRISTSFSAGEAVCPRTVVPDGPAAVPRCALPLRRSGVSCDQMDGLVLGLHGHFFSGLVVDMMEKDSVTCLFFRGLYGRALTRIWLSVYEPPCGLYVSFLTKFSLSMFLYLYQMLQPVPEAMDQNTLS